MTGRAEVARLKQRLDATFKRVKEAGPDLEIQSDFARYLCVLVSGFLEKSISELVVQHSRNIGVPTLQRFVHQRTKLFANAKTQKISDLLGDFDPDWKLKFDRHVAGEIRDAIDAVVSLRNQIAHGQSVGVTFATIADYYVRVQKATEFIADLCEPK